MQRAAHTIRLGSRNVSCTWHNGGGRKHGEQQIYRGLPPPPCCHPWPREFPLSVSEACRTSNDESFPAADASPPAYEPSSGRPGAVCSARWLPPSWLLIRKLAWVWCNLPIGGLGHTLQLLQQLPAYPLRDRPVWCVRKARQLNSVEGGEALLRGGPCLAWAGRSRPSI